MSKKIVIRLASRGQYEIENNQEDLLKDLNNIDNQIVALLSETEAKVQTLLAQMEDEVSDRGERITDELIDSDLILPPDDLNLSEAADLFQGEGIFSG